MLVQLTPRYKFVCDRCGKEQFADADNNIYDTWNAIFMVNDTFVKVFDKKGEICAECKKDFIEIAENFFDEANIEKGADDE